MSGKLDVEAGKISGLVTKTDGHTTDIGKLKLTTNEFTTTMGQVKGDLSNVVGDLSVQKQTVTALQGTVENKAEQSQVTQLANQYSVILNDVNDNKTSIATALGNINLMVKKGDVMSQINLEAGRALFQANKLLFDAQTIVFGANSKKGDVMSQINLEAGRALFQANKLLFDAQTIVFGANSEAFIPAALITDLVADLIEVGTLNGANVNVINLNASNLVTGFLSSDRIAGRSITGKKIVAGSITADEIAANAITASKIAAGAVTADDIITGTLTGIMITGPNLKIDLQSGYMETRSGSRSTQFTTGQIEFEDGVNETKILRAQGDGLVVRSDGYSDNVGLRLVGNGSSFLDFYKGKNESEYARFQLIDGSGGDDGLFLLDLKQSPGDEFGVQFSGMSGPARYSGSNRYFKMAYGGIMAYLYNNGASSMVGISESSNPLYNNGASSMVGISESSNPNSYLPIWASQFKQDSNREEKEDIKPVGQTGVTTVRNLKIYD